MSARTKIAPEPRRRGRPAESDGLTGKRILTAARVCFAEAGYAGASTHTVAARVGLTTGALYHHFASKRDLYLAVFAEVEELMVERFEKAAAPHARFTDKVEAILDEILRLSREEPTVTGFLQSMTADFGRHPELLETIVPAFERRDEMFSGLVEAGIASGELVEEDRAIVLDTVTTILVGLVAMNLGQLPSVQQHAVDGYKRLLRGALVKTKKR